VDPLDGTKEFRERNGEFTVNIALVVGTRPCRCRANQRSIVCTSARLV
jgi:3'-phosphoadenosine 5'-phosphosulfate (PAPS) 3'-phosphatase